MMLNQEKQHSSPSSFNDTYLAMLALSLLGYALMGKGFAYIGVPPLFIGELLFVLGLVAFLATGCWIAVMASLPSLLLAAMIALVLWRTIPFLGIYGFDAARDSVIVMYSGFAFVMIALLLERPGRLRTILRYFQILATIYVPGVLLFYYVSKVAEGAIPTWPGTGVPLILIRTGEMGVHLAGAAILALLGLVRVKTWWVLALLFAIVTVASQSRGGALAFLLPSIGAAVIAGKFRQLAVTVFMATAVFCVFVLADIKIDVGAGLSPEEPRKVSATQVVKNLSGIVGQSEGALKGTKEFRLNWWSAIINYTFNGQYYWTGKGFGVNLAESDGFLVSEREGAPPLRSPHNAHMTILARSGVPGLFLWAATCAAWFYMLTRSMIRGRRRKEMVWANFFLFLMCYVASIIINATFDVVLEGPILGIWFWCLFGVGIGSSMIYSARRTETAVDF